MNPMETQNAIVNEIAIAAPAARVFDAIAQPEHRVKWWGVKGRFEVTGMESDLRIGGAWKMNGVTGEGGAFVFTGAYIAIDRPTLLEFTWNPNTDEAPSRVRFELEENDGVTTVRVTHYGFAEDAARERYKGWAWLLSMLQGYVQNALEG